MTLPTRVVTVKQFPEKLNPQRERLFIEELESAMNDVDRPRIVLDFSGVTEMNWPSLHLLLFCLEEAMKRNGDVKVAGLREGAMANLRLVGMDRLFEMFDTNTAAVNSFRRLSVDPASGSNQAASLGRPSENAA